MSYGKHFASMYSGSLFGKPAIVFAVLGYVIANQRPSRKDGECYVEVNPTLLAATFATTVQEVTEALTNLESPDPASRTKREEGRRLVLMADARHTGPMQYRVVNGARFRAARDEEERREYLREAKRAERSRKRVNNVNRGQPRSTQAEAEAEAKAKRLSDLSREEAFELRWSRYPKKDGKSAARRHFFATVQTDEDLRRFDRALANYLRKIQLEKAAPRYVKNGSTFFNNWEDYVEWSPTAKAGADAERPEGREGVVL